MVEHILVSFATVVAVWTLVTLLTKLNRILTKWKYIQDKNYAILAAMLRKRSFCQGSQETDIVQGQISVHFFVPNGGYCVYYLSNVFRDASSFENWGIYKQ